MITPPVIPGHEFTGEIVEVGGGVSGLAVGDRVSVESHIPCGRCALCRNNQRHICRELKIFGIDRDGSFAEYVTVPAVCTWSGSKDLPVEWRSIMEPLGNAVHAVDEAGVRGKHIAVFGCGPAGLFAVAVARAMDAARIIGIDINADRLSLAARMGAHETRDGAEPGLIDQLLEMTKGTGLDAVLEMSGSPEAFTNALRSLRPGGRLVAFGIPSQPIRIDLAADVIMKQRQVIGVVGRRLFETWERMQDLLDSGRLDPSPIITHTFKLSEFEAAIETIKTKKGLCGKVILKP